MTTKQRTRQQLGQWFTPEPVAELALSLALGGAPAPSVLLDPSCGDGVFLRAAAKRGLATESLLGLDIDPIALREARLHVPGAQLIEGDFFEFSDLPKADVIVGNPPYVRQERIAAAAKSAIAKHVTASHDALEAGAVEALIGRSDLAAPFVLRLLSQLRPGGVAALVLSSAFFDSGYGAEFWALAERIASLRLVVDASEERWFSEAAVHAVIAVFDEGQSAKPVRLARLTRSTREVASHLAQGGALEAVSEERSASRSTPSSWSAALRASTAWLEFTTEAGELLVPLGELASVRRGITTGANEIFYLHRDELRKLDIDPQFLRPLLTARGRGGQGSIAVSSDELELFALVIPRDTNLAEHPGLARYLQSFSEAPTKRTLRNRQPWWSLRATPGQVFLCKAYAERFVQPYSAFPMVADQRMYCLEPALGVSHELLAALLNATSTALALESLGRASMGQGALEWTVGDVAKLPVLDIRKHPMPQAVLDAFRPLAARTAGPVRAEAECADRIALDEALLGPWQPLAAKRAGLSQALARGCRSRSTRSKAGLR